MGRNAKTRVTVGIPLDLKEFLREVAHRIAEKDDATLFESDDLLQSECAYGGLVEDGGVQFGFTYFVDDHTTWEILLNRSEIEDVACGDRTDLNLWRCSSDTCRCLYPTEDCYCRHCDSIRHFDDGFQSQLLRCHPNEPPQVLELLAKLRKVVIAILDYHADNGRMPPPFTTSSAVERLHSWRA